MSYQTLKYILFQTICRLDDFSTSKLNDKHLLLADYCLFYSVSKSEPVSIFFDDAWVFAGVDIGWCDRKMKVKY